MGLAKLLALFMILLLLGSAFAGLIINFIQWIYLQIGNFTCKIRKKFYGYISVLKIEQELLYPLTDYGRKDIPVIKLE